MNTLEGKVAVVTGASRGIGRAIAKELAAAGASVVLAARTTDATPSRLPGTVDATAREIAAAGGRAIAVPVDITSDDQVEALARRTAEEFGPAHILVNNAGISFPAPIMETPMKRWDLVLGVNLRGAVVCTKAFVPQMREIGEGRVLNVSSYLAETLMPGMLSYSVSKIALEKLTQGLAAELREDHIAVNALRIEKFIATEGWMLRNPDEDYSTWEKPEACAVATRWLLEQDATYTGEVVTLDQVSGLMAGHR